MRIFVGAVAALALGACAQQAPAPLTGEALVARGDYLVNGVVLCGDCHTPRLENMAPDEARRLQGAAIPPSGPPEVFATIAPPLAGGPANYTEEQFIAFLQTGVRPDGSHPRPPMPPYRLNEDDARAVNAYIRSLPQTAQE
jgi:mono/diheme cytochrome c family protein